MAPDVERSPTASDHGGGDESADEALRAFAGLDSGERGVLVIDAATNKRLLRRIDLNIMPARKLKYHKLASPSKREMKNESSCG